MFEDCSPNIGHYCLAALARSRRVVVLNLNWDDMVAQAASALEVECDHFDIQEVGVEGPKSSPGLTVIHLHGSLSTTPRFRLLDTAAFSAEQIEVVKGICCDKTLVCVGASLLEELDANTLLRALGTVQCEGYYFSRGEQHCGDTQVKSAQFGPLFEDRLWTAPDFDYDRFMLVLLGGVRGEHTRSSTRISIDKTSTYRCWNVRRFPKPTSPDSR